MQDYRRALKDHFESQPLMRNLFMADIILFSVGLLFLLFHEFSIITLNSDVFFALGFWFFWIGIVLSYIKKSDVSLSIGLGLYALLYLVKFIIACVHSAGGYGGFYGFSPLCNVIVALFFLSLSVRESEYYQQYLEQKKALLLLAQRAPKAQEPEQGMIRCPKCDGTIGLNTKFCPHCGNKIPELKRCKQCESPLPENPSFCVICGAKVESE
ncbi:zinc ribbon domain-containing protein [Desulfosporosinus metallidurans]|uniref:DZANK-type domain-containing protein n=1 Tax=Desulfosporosinus metallidurans TaxID=1888891 RepID=A0A1Q8QWN8_9FIRM|nr:zinc ribbon domain-containing protein [Desulfosporosinus metallidurans]OLN31728.1 hypothetical protein DSOL_2416 [Desulfosporosinus metallidurans]